MLIIDRFEGDFAVCERDDLTTIELPISILPKGAKSGSVLCQDKNGIYRLDTEEEKRRRARIKTLEDQIFGE